MKDSEKLDELIKFKEGVERDEAISHGIKIRCITFWSGILGFFGLIGGWCSNHFDAISAGFKAFWAVLWQQK